MADSQFRLVGRGLGVLAAASLLAGVSLDAAAAGNKGVIRLQLGKAGVADGFYFYAPDGVTPTGDFQKFTVTQKCIVDTNGWTLDGQPDGPGKLVNLQALGPTGSGNPRPGLLSGSLGVYDNSKGVSCTRMTASIEEGLLVETLVGGFDRLSLDMELKGNAIFELQIVSGRKYTLRSGTSRIPGGYEGEADPSNLVVNCAGSSDSGPDSGPSDNCEWVINDVGSAFSLKAVAGEGSLEGGGDFAGLLGDFDTKIYLTSLIDIGNLGCNPSNNKTAMVFADAGSATAASCRVTRINPNNFSAGSCTGEIGYRLETFSFDSMCQLDKTGGVDDQLAGSIQITFEPEPRPADWDGVAKTAITFTKPDGTQTGDFYANRCQGTVVEDANGNLTILEVLSSPTPSWVADQIAGNGFIDWACVLDNREVFIGDVADDLMQVTQTILFWGDINWSRL